MDKFIGIDLGGSGIRFNDLDINGNAGEERQARIEPSINEADLTEVILSNLKVIVERVCSEGNKVAGIGFGSPGPLDFKKGIIETPPNLPNIKNVPIVKIIEKSFQDLPVFLVHDADAALLGEQWLGTAKNLKNVVMVTFGTGVGFSAVSGGGLIRGKGRASEAGHTDIYVEGERRLCSCGRYNHWEPFVNTDGLAQIYSEVFGVSNMNAEEKYKISFEIRKWPSADKDKLKWEEVFEGYADYVVRGLKNVLCNFNPECIILGGGIMTGNDTLLRIIISRWNSENFGSQTSTKTKDKMSILAVGVDIKLAALPNSGVIGAAKYAMDCIDREKEEYAVEHGIVT